MASSPEDPGVTTKETANPRDDVTQPHPDTQGKNEENNVPCEQTPEPPPVATTPRSNKSQERLNDDNASTDWLIHTLETKTGVCCVVRGSASVMPLVKRGITVVTSGIPQPEDLPPLPDMEFEEVDKRHLKPICLKWDHPFINKPYFSEPVYIAIPVSADTFNHIIQQVLFLYTTDRKSWKYKEGAIIKIKPTFQDYSFVEVSFDESFSELLIAIRARYREDVAMVGPEGADVASTMEPGISFVIPADVYREKAKVRLKIEPLDLNETDLELVIPSPHAARAVAVSPIVKITSGRPMYAPATLIVPKPGHSVFGSTKLGLRSQIKELRNPKVHLLIKTPKKREIIRFQEGTTLETELANEYRFQVEIHKPKGCCYCLLVLEGTEPNVVPSSVGKLEDRDFLSESFLKDFAMNLDGSELHVRALGRQLLNITATDAICRQYRDELPLAAYRILKRWHNQNMRTDETHLTKRFVCALRDSGMVTAADDVRNQYDHFLDTQEGEVLERMFDELSTCPAVIIIWKFLGRKLGLSDDVIIDLERSVPSLQDRCGRMLRQTLEEMQHLTFRDIFCFYMALLKDHGCPRISATMEKRYLKKFRT